jgi:hypothetical protein
VIRTLCFLAALLPAIASAQLQLYVAPSNSETAVSGVYDLGSAPVGDALETRFRVRNHGVAPVTVTIMGVAGTGFSMKGQPSLPYILATGLNLDFTIRFQARDSGSYSANLSINGTSVLLRASAAAAASIRAAGQPIAAGASVDFGRVERGTSADILFELVNATNQPVAIRTTRVSGTGFSSSALPPSAELAPGAAISFSVRFEPGNAGVFTGSLMIDGREVRLTGAASEPPFTRPAVVLESFAAESAKQGRVAVRFASPSRASGTGRLLITFQPASTVDNDTGILFPATGGRSIPLTVAAGDSEAKFGEAALAVFQTGTTAGTIILTAEIGGFTEQTSIVIPPSPVKFDQSVAARSGNSLEVKLIGFDNTQTSGEVVFTFYDRGGKPVQPGAIRANVREDFKRYFDAAKLGGTFSLRATFPVAGNVADIDSVEVEFANSAGSARTSRLRF